MDAQTVILNLTIGSFVFAALLFLFERQKPRGQRIHFWVPAKCMQGLGSLLLYLLGLRPDLNVVLSANVLLLLGCSYEAWAIFHITGRPVSTRLHLSVTAAIGAACLGTYFLPSHDRMAVVFTIHAILYGLPAWALLRWGGRSASLRTALGSSFAALALIFCVQAVLALVSPFPAAPGSFPSMFQGVPPIAIYCLMLVSGFSLLLLAKEKSDDDLCLTKQSLLERDAQYRLIVDNAMEGIITLDRENRISFLNQRMAAMLGYDIIELLGRSYIDFLAADQLADDEKQRENRAKGLDGVYERRFLHKDGTPRWLLVSAKVVMDASGHFNGSFAMLTDIDARKKMETALEESNRRLRTLNIRDGLTGIANRSYFDEVLAKEYRRHARSGAPFSLIMLDIDHFKAFNDHYGHVQGDACLRQVSALLATRLNRAGDLAARYGGEEFVCIMAETDSRKALSMANAVLRGVASLAIPHETSPTADHVTASIGVITAFCEGHGSPLDLLVRVDDLLYRAKAAGRAQVVAACALRSNAPGMRGA